MGEKPRDALQRISLIFKFGRKEFALFYPRQENVIARP
jgi:hypothetical protein